jgi:AmmeMemoRadiSam system protein B
MSAPLPSLRRGLDLMPSPVEDRPGLLIRDPFRYSETVLIIPPPLVSLLAHFDGERSAAEVREALVRGSGEAEAGTLLDHLLHTLSTAGFLEDDLFAAMKQEREAAFTQAPRREAAHAGSAYPVEPGALGETLRGYLDGAEPELAPRPGLKGIAAPHVSPEGGWRSYRAAYRALGPELAQRTFVVLGTSHYGAQDRFGLTRKNYVTPLGESTSDQALIERLMDEGGPAVSREDYCHSVEHSIEFQVVFLQHLYGPAVRVVPILCGPFVKGLLSAERPEDDEGVARFLGVLAQLAAQEGDRLLWVLGVDMAHLGRRYGDGFRARADFGRLARAALQDRERIERIAAGDADGFWRLVREDADPLRWCGASPFYTFLKAVRPARGELLDYHQWNIDEASVVTFAGLVFS